MVRAVVVTGASSGIGAAVVLDLIDRSYLVLGAVRHERDAERLRRVGATPIILDVTDSGSIARAAREVGRVVGPHGLAGLVNSAGVPEAGPLEHMPIEALRRVLEVNLIGAVAVTQAFLPLLRTARGRIVNLSSVSGRIAMPFMGAYAASKFGLEAVSDALRRELQPFGVGVVVIQPGSVRTPIWDRVSELDDSPYRDTDYQGALSRFRQAALAGGEDGLDASVVARAVARSLGASRPPTRILLVKGGRWRRILAGWLPDRWLDRVIARTVWR